MAIFIEHATTALKQAIPANSTGDSDGKYTRIHCYYT